VPPDPLASPKPLPRTRCPPVGRGMG
jgi:hypothetical protein